MTPGNSPLTGRTALVTGGTRGIGRAVVARLVGLGARLVLTGTDAAAAERVAGAEGALGIGCDVRSDASVATLGRFVGDRFGRLDLLVNNAGLGIYRPVGEMEVDDFRAVVETNLVGPFRVLKACLPLLLDTAARAGHATVVNVGSLAGRHPFAGGAAYNASKFGLLGMTEAMMLDLRGHGVRVATVMPGSVATGFAGRSPEDGAGWKLAPEDVAAAVAHIASQRGGALASRIELRPSRPPAG